MHLILPLQVRCVTDRRSDVVSSYDIHVHPLEGVEHPKNRPKTRKCPLGRAILISIAFITENCSVEPLLEGLCAQLHVNLS